MADSVLGIGATIHLVLGVPATYDETGYEALTYAEVDDVVDIGGGGGSSSSVDYTKLKTGVKVSSSGEITYNVRTVTLGDHLADAGNIALKAGFDGANAGAVHSFKILSPNGDAEYFTGTIGSYAKGALSAGSYIHASCDIRPRVKSVEVAA